MRIIDYRSKQKILYIERTNPADLQNYGDTFFDEGHYPDALEFYQRAESQSGLQKIKDIALELGDVMLFQQAARALRLELKPADWDAVGRKAMELKKYLFAQYAMQKADNQEMLAALRKMIG